MMMRKSNKFRWNKFISTNEAFQKFIIFFFLFLFSYVKANRTIIARCKLTLFYSANDAFYTWANLVFFSLQSYNEFCLFESHKLSTTEGHTVLTKNLLCSSGWTECTNRNTKFRKYDDFVTCTRTNDEKNIIEINLILRQMIFLNWYVKREPLDNAFNCIQRTKRFSNGRFFLFENSLRKTLLSTLNSFII